MIADLIHLRFQVDYAPRYVSHLLDLLGFSYQRGKFSADHLNDEAALLWLEETWPETLRRAHERHAVILFGDEASFAQWGSLGYTWALTQVAGHVLLIQDNAAYHTSTTLRTFYAQQADCLTVCQLSAYSPDLNPIEGLWRKVKKEATHLRYFPR